MGECEELLKRYKVLVSYLAILVDENLKDEAPFISKALSEAYTLKALTNNYLARKELEQFLKEENGC